MNRYKITRSSVITLADEFVIADRVTFAPSGALVFEAYGDGEAVDSTVKAFAPREWATVEVVPD